MNGAGGTGQFLTGRKSCLIPVFAAVLTLAGCRAEPPPTPPMTSAMPATGIATTTIPPTATLAPTPTEPACPLQTNEALEAAFQNEIERISQLDATGMDVPDEAALARWQSIILGLAAGDLPSACEALKQAGFPYQIVDFKPGSGGRILMLRENSPHTLGWGFYLFNPSPLRELVIEAPHPATDQLTGIEALGVFRQTGAAALLVAGTSRCAGPQATSIPGQVLRCDPDESRGDSDVAHLERSAFQAAHQALLPCDGKRVALQLHGHARNRCPDVFVSNTLGAPGELSTALVKNIRLACSHTSASQPGPKQSCPLAGIENVQGAYLRACPAGEGERFIQIEQSFEFRQKPECLSTAINAVFPTLMP